MEKNRRKVIDQMGMEVLVPDIPMKIISLVPSLSELLADLGLKDRLIAVTKFCIHPPELKKQLSTIGGTKNLNIPLISQLNPDLIIGNKEENEKDQILALKNSFPVWVSDIYSLNDAYQMISAIGELVNETARATKVKRSIVSSMNTLKPVPKRVLYLIWRKPYMVAGGHTFIHHMLDRAGFINCAEHLPRYPELTESDILQLNPELILLSSEPYPFKQSHVEVFKKKFAIDTMLVDGEMFSWYGSRLKYFSTYFNSLPLA